MPYSLSLPDNCPPSLRRLSTGWLMTGVLALALAGLFSILLVLARTPQIQEVIPYKDFFHTALVVHVDLSVLVWFLANACLLWYMAAPRLPALISRSALLCVAGGSVLMAISPFVGEHTPLMNNYVPVLEGNALFFISLSLIGVGVLIQACGMLAMPGRSDSAVGRICTLGCITAAAIALYALAITVYSGSAMPQNLAGEQRFETLFWAGGHILQFTHTQLLIVVWLALSAAIGLPNMLKATHAKLILWVGALAVAGSIYGLLSYEVGSGNFQQFFTLHMYWLNGTYLIPVGIALLIGLVRSRPTTRAQRPLRNALWASLLLFAYGGIIGMTIREIDVTVPAHYHGSIVGISLAFMGLHFFLLPRLGFAPVTGKLACIQPFLYGGGQALHITGLLISGGYDVARKSTETLDGAMGAKIGMGLMGAGGGIAILGGVAFVVVVLRSIGAKRSH